jgi:hypothetical protein
MPPAPFRRRRPGSSGPARFSPNQPTPTPTPTPRRSSLRAPARRAPTAGSRRGARGGRRSSRAAAPLPSPSPLLPPGRVSRCAGRQKSSPAARSAIRCRSPETRPPCRRRHNRSSPARRPFCQAAFLKEHPGVVVTVTATCTPEEGKRFGPGVLATLRASKVRDELIARGGVARARVEAAASDASAAICDAASGRAVIMRN